MHSNISDIDLYVALFVLLYVFAVCFLIHSTIKTRNSNGDNMKESDQKSLLNKAHKQEEHHDVVIVKTENEFELDGDAEKGFSELYTNGDGLNIQIKEEPQSEEISEENSDRDTSSCSDSKPEPVTSRSDLHHQQSHIKAESDSDRESEYELSGAAVKQEAESWIKEDRDSEDEAEDPGKMQGDNEEGEELCTGTLCCFFLVVLTQLQPKTQTLLEV